VRGATKVFLVAPPYVVFKLPRAIFKSAPRAAFPWGFARANGARC